MTETQLIKFWSRVDKSGDCWEWTGCKTPQGYGLFFIKRGISQLRAHRISYELANGNIPEGMIICHSCDNPPCVNPDHLWAGTIIDNNLDCIKKGRNCKGEKSSFSKLTPKKVAEIRALAFKLPYPKIAQIFGITRSNVGQIIRNNTWIDPLYTPPAPFNFSKREAFGESKSLSEWVKDPRCRCSLITLRSRAYQKDCDLEAAITTPSNRNNKPC